MRERWRSVVIPDPNLDLTSQTFRQKRLERENCENKKRNENETQGGNPRKRPAPSYVSVPI